MADQFYRTSHQGYFSRLANSVFGVFLGLVLVPGSVLLISWNEYRTVHRARGLIEAEKVVVEVRDPLEILPSLDQRLVHVSGTATTEETLTDSDFSIDRVALRLERQVEMFQWIEHRESKTRDKIGGGRETITTYEYRKEWKSDRVQSERFEEKVGHSNPQPSFASLSLVAEHATLGAFEFRPQLVRTIHAWKDLQLDLEKLLTKFDNASKKQFKIEGERLYYGTSNLNPDEPKIGDLKIRFRVVEPSVISLLSKQSGQKLEPFRTINGEFVELVREGEVSAALMFDSLRRENTFMGWILRCVGWVMSCIGFSLIAGPLKGLANVFPPLAGLVGLAAAAVAVLLGSIVSLVTIGLAWIAVRPTIGISLFVLAGVGIYFLLRRKRPRELPMAVLVK